MYPLLRFDYAELVTLILLGCLQPVEPELEASTSAESTPEPARVILTRDLFVAGYERAHPELCPVLGKHIRLLILVMSAPENKMAREAVRLTWGHYAARSDIAMGFMLGEPPAELKTAIDAEDTLYGDIIISRSVDSYFNLTLKTLSMLQWMDKYCSCAPRMLKTDDDMFINVPLLLSWAAAPERANATRTIWGKVERGGQPWRNNDSKYYMSPVQYPAQVYPDYATGAAYLLTADIVRPLLRTALAQPYMPLEDVFLTGVLGKQLGITLVNETTFYNVKMEPDPCIVQRGISIHEVSYHEQFQLWRKVVDKKTNCTAYCIANNNRCQK